jgi:inner membrane protein
MASAFSHAVAAVAIGSVFYNRKSPKIVWIAGAICAAMPDLDSIGFRFGVHYADFWGHRGFTHSLTFAALLAAMLSYLLSTNQNSRLESFKLWGFLFLATASHGLLDGMTNGGLGVAFFSPIDKGRYFLPLRPIAVAPISIRRFFTERGILVMQTELLWIWIPALFLGTTAWFLRRPPVAGDD